MPLYRVLFFRYTSANGLGIHRSNSPPKRLDPSTEAEFSENLTLILLQWECLVAGKDE